MFFKSRKTANSKQPDTNAIIAGMVDRTQATIQFHPDGTIITANQNFLNALGYDLEEIQGKHHSMFVAPELVASEEYRTFWSDLASGKAFTDQFPRMTKSGETIWIQATYAPVEDDTGKVERVVKVASDVTERRRGLEAIGAGLKELSEGNLAYRIEASNQPDIAALGDAFNHSLEQLATTVGAVKQVSAAVGRTSDEIAQAANDLSQRTESQAATLEETAAALEELTATVKASADGARNVEEIVTDAKASAERSGEVVTSAVDAMSKIENSSEQISKIIGVIDDIAFQTNLLALNAGVEAARAGEAGRGFAVVASEVRALAQRSSDAAGEIKQLISESNQQVGNGVSLVGKSGQELQQIIKSVATISDHIREIATGASEQSTALSEINMGVSQLDQVTQQNAAMVEETSAASQMLSNDASQLTQEISKFKGDTAPPAAAKSLPQAHPPMPDADAAFDDFDQEVLPAAQGWDNF